MADVVCKTPNDISFLLWGGKQYDVWTKSIHDSHIDYINNTYDGYRLYDMRQFNFLYYKRSIINLHHVILPCYIRIVYPYLSDILKFPYKRSDFDLYPYNQEEMECSFLWPKKEMEWTVNINQQPMAEHEGFRCLTNIDKKYLGDTSSPYHRIFCSSHKCCRIINESLPNGKSILVSGDSYMIPVIPILACYYHEVVSMDNRQVDPISNASYYEGKVFDQVVIACSECSPLEKYTGWNLA